MRKDIVIGILVVAALIALIVLFSPRKERRPNIPPAQTTHPTATPVPIYPCNDGKCS